MNQRFLPPAEPRDRAGAAAGTPTPNDYGAAAEPSLAGDLLQGAKAIAAHLGLPVRRVVYLLELGQLPAFRWGGRVCARKSRLRQHIERLEAGAGHGAR